MLKKTITYVDYNGTERKEDFWFNLTKAELVEMETGVTGGLSQMIQTIIQTQDVPTIVKTFKDLICKSYGVKSADGKQFIKNKEVLDAFIQSEAYSNLFMELASNAEIGAEFINGILPADLPKQSLAEFSGKV